MRISVFGLGYVGSTSAGCLAHEGCEVIGVDINPTKVNMINSGRSPIIEPALDDIIHQTVRERKLRATQCAQEAVENSDISFLSVATPSRNGGGQDLSSLRAVCAEVGRALRKKSGYHLVVLRSTVLPGTTEAVVLPILEQESGKSVGKGFGLCVNPEFLREGSAVSDFKNPELTLIGRGVKNDGVGLQQLYRFTAAPIVVTQIRAAEMVKYVSNAFHALKVSFANEIGRLCKSLGIDSHEVMNVFMSDRRLNISPAYLRPGFAFGGSCLLKDLQALLHLGRSADLEIPLLSSVLPSNAVQLELGLQTILNCGKKRVGVVGLSFKAGTDDLRESPMVELVERLLGKGFSLRVYDKNVSLARLMGANRAYIHDRIPHISSLLCSSLAEVLDHAEVIVIGTQSEEIGAALRRVREDHIIVDLVRAVDPACTPGRYEGLCW